MQAAVPARGGPKLTDILGLVAMQGQAEHVARVGPSLNRATWSDPDLWRPCINVVFGKTKLADNNYAIESTARTRLMVYLEHGRADLVELALSYGADPNLNTTFLHEDKMYTIRTPLQCAIGKKTYSLARLLLEHGADPNQVFVPGDYIFGEQNPLKLASKRIAFPLVRLLIDEYGVKVPGAFPPDQVVSYAKIPFCQPLASAIGNNNLSMVRYFVETKGVRVNHLNPERFAWSKEEEKWDAGEDDIDDNVVSYLEYALSMNAAAVSIEMVTYLLDAGAVMNFLSSDSESPLYSAVSRRRMDVVVLLLARGADPNLAKGWDQETPIIAAAENNDMQMAAVLVRAGANVLASVFSDDAQELDEMLVEGYTALHHFVEHINAEGVALMLQEGAEIDALTFSGLTPILLVAKKASPTRIDAACKCCRLLVGAGADVNHVRVLPGDFLEFQNSETDESRFSALTYATELGAPALVGCLIDLGARITHCIKHSFSLLMRAAAKGHVEVLAILVEAAQSLPQAHKVAFLDLRYRNDDDPEDEWNGCSALHFCLMNFPQFDVANSRARCVKILVDAGVSVLSTDRRRLTPLDLALETESTNIVNMILIASHLQQAGADVDIVSWQTRVTHDGVAYNTKVNALCYLAMSGLENLCARFCARLTKAQIDQVHKCEAQVECVDSDGERYFEVRTAHYSALTLAMQHSDDCAQTLIEYGASPLAPSPLTGLPDLSLANSPLMQAIEKGNKELVSSLAASLIWYRHWPEMLVQAVKSASIPCAAVLLGAIKRFPTPQCGDDVESPLVLALRLENFDMAEMIARSVDAWELGTTDPAPEPRGVKLCLEVKVPLFVYSSPWLKAPAEPGQTLSVNFLGWKMDYCIPDGVAPGQTIRVAKEMMWRPPGDLGARRGLEAARRRGPQHEAQRAAAGHRRDAAGATVSVHRQPPRPAHLLRAAGPERRGDLQPRRVLHAHSDEQRGVGGLVVDVRCREKGARWQGVHVRGGRRGGGGE